MNIFILLFILVSGFFEFQAIQNEVVITGQINGKIPDKVEYTVPVNGVCYWGFREHTAPDTNGDFTISLHIDKATAIMISAPGVSYGFVIVEPDEKYHVIFGSSTDGPEFQVINRNNKGQEFYNLLPRPVHIQIPAKKLCRDSTHTGIINKLSSDMANEILQFKNLLISGDISQSFFNFVLMDRRCYYAAIQSEVALLTSFEDQRKKNGIFTPDFENMLLSAFLENPPNDPHLIQSYWYKFYIDNYIDYYVQVKNPPGEKEINEIKKIGLHTYYYNKATDNLSGAALEFYLARNIDFACLNQRHDKDLISVYDRFKSDFPQSKYQRFLEPLIEREVEFQAKAEQPFNTDILFIEDAENINSLQDAINAFKGNKIYIDVWASWCGPCIEEFKYKEKLKPYLDSMDIKILYLSIDKEVNAEKWKAMIKFHDLAGYHLRANEQLSKNLRTIFDRDGSISIPWYLLIDEHGVIKELHAQRPSKIQDLKKQISKI